MKYAKKVVLVTLTMMILAVTAVIAHAAPRWTYLITMAADMEFEDNNIVHIYVDCDADANDVNKMTVKCELQQYNGSWKTIKSWTETENDSIVGYSKDYAVAKEYSYRLLVTAAAYKGSKLLEKVTEDFAEQFYR